MFKIFNANYLSIIWLHTGAWHHNRTRLLLSLGLAECHVSETVHGVCETDQASVHSEVIDPLVFTACLQVDRKGASLWRMMQYDLWIPHMKRIKMGKLIQLLSSQKLQFVKSFHKNLFDSISWKKKQFTTFWICRIDILTHSKSL